MPEESTPAPRRYTAFLSYCHADNREEGRQWAEWLHQALETYEVPDDLVGKPNDRGEPIPASLYPVFRDEAELRADANLSEPIHRALENSSALIVLCSPRASQSRFVADEIRYFKELGKSDRIFALILDGEPNADEPRKAAAGITPEMECFPEPLRCGTARADGTIDWTAPTEPIAADVRPQNRAGQGYTSPAAYRAAGAENEKHTGAEWRLLQTSYAEQLNLSRLKLIAGLAGVPLGQLTLRDAAYRSRKFRRLATVFGAIALVAVVAGIFAMFQANRAREAKKLAQTRLGHAERARDAAQDLVSKTIFGLRDKLAAIGKIGVLEDIASATEDYYAKLPVELTSETTLRHQGSLALNRAIIASGIGDDETVEIMSNKALAIAEGLTSNYPKDAGLRDDQVAALAGLAQLFFEQGRTAEADASAGKLLALADRWLALEPNSPEALKARLIGYALRFSFRTRTAGDLKASLPLFLQCQTVASQLKERSGETLETRMVDGVVKIAYGMLSAKSGDAEGARRLFDEADTYFNKVLEASGGHPFFRQMMLSARGNAIAQLISIADQTQNQTLIDEANRQSQERVREWEKLTEQEPARLEWWIKLAMSYRACANIELMMKNQSAQLRWYEKALAAAEHAASPRFDRPTVRRVRAAFRIDFASYLRQFRPPGWEARSLKLIEEGLEILLAPAKYGGWAATDRDYGDLLLRSWREIVSDLDSPDRAAATLEEFRKLATTAERIIAAVPDSPQPRLSAAGVAGQIETFLREHNRPEVAEFAAHRDRWREEARQKFPDAPEVLLDEAQSARGRPWQLLQEARAAPPEGKSEKYAQVKASARAALDFLDKNAANLPAADVSRWRGEHFTMLGAAQMDRKEFPAAEESLRDAISAGQKAIPTIKDAREAADFRWGNVIGPQWLLSFTLIETGRVDEGRTLLRQLVETQEEVARAFPNADRFREIAYNWQQFANQWRDAADGVERLMAHQKRVEACRTAIRLETEVPQPRADILDDIRSGCGVALLDLGLELRQSNRSPEAEAPIREAVTMAESRIATPFPGREIGSHAQLAHVRCELARTLLDNAHPDEARAILDLAAADLRQFQEKAGHPIADFAEKFRILDEVRSRLPPQP